MGLFDRFFAAPTTVEAALAEANQHLLQERWTRAERSARRAQELGDRSGEAEAYLAVALTQLGRPDEARKLAQAAADLGQPFGMFTLHQMHFTGVGGPIDLDAAKLWCERSAQAGYPRACFNLGAFHAEGRNGYPKDAEVSRVWYQKAADAGHPQAAFNLGMLLTLSVQPPNRDGAAQCFLRSAQLGFPAARILTEQGQTLLSKDTETATWFLAVAATLDRDFARAISGPGSQS